MSQFFKEVDILSFELLMAAMNTALAIIGQVITLFLASSFAGYALTVSVFVQQKITPHY
jgi:hypothetical protein